MKRINKNKATPKNDKKAIPEWHLQIVREREAKYANGGGKWKSWEQVKKKL